VIVIFALSDEKRADKNKRIEDLLASIADGNPDPMGELYDLIKTDVFAFALSKTANKHDADDILHDTFIQIYRYAKQYVPKGKPMAWILTVEHNLIRRARQLDMVSMPGALTPTEVVAAYEMGADIVKLFPAGELGLGYIKAVRGPLRHIPMSAVGGVKPENVKDFLDAGVCGFGVGGQLVLAKAVKSGDDAAIEARAKEFTEAIAQWEAAK